MSNYKDMDISVKVIVSRDGAQFGPGTSQLLRLIEENGSVRHAAEAMKISYGKTWKMIRDVETALGEEVVSRQQGGPAGGSAVVTEAGKELIKRYDQVVTDIKGYADEHFREVFH